MRRHPLSRLFPRATPLAAYLVGSALGLPLLSGGCGGKPETGAQASTELQKARDESARAAEEYAKEQQEAAKAKRK
ncbi:hypothetical protein TA3x_003195 [Tundrisphaera sp. TA3]|uniref:hypothetical protein n=1 Tax=Tundrisphaera sp. TA3 TaxID=3435775 RepID=UPI003EBB47C0